MTNLGSLFPEDLQPEKKSAQAKGAAAPAAQKAPANGGKPAAPTPKPVSGTTARPARQSVQDLTPGKDVESIFLVQEATLRAAKNGSRYIQANLCDRTGSVPVRFWDATERDFEPFKQGSYVRIRGRAEQYKNMLQLVAQAAQPVDPNGVDPADFLPVSKRPLPEMIAEFEALLATFTDPDYKRLLDALFADQKTREAYYRGPAASAIHHAWSSGLLEHVLSACKTAKHVAEERPFLNRDLLMAGVILHDIGKIIELDPGPGFNYTDTGRLMGHIVLGTLLVERVIIGLPDFPARKRNLILHMILSHHGEREHGSPVTPAFAEAVALHHIECMDAKVQGIQSMIEREVDNGNATGWSEFARVVDGRIYLGARPGADEPAP